MTQDYQRARRTKSRRLLCFAIVGLDQCLLSTLKLSSSQEMIPFHEAAAGVSKPQRAMTICVRLVGEKGSQRLLISRLTLQLIP